MADEQRNKPSDRLIPFSDAFKEFIPTGWAPYPETLPDPLPATAWTPARRSALSRRFPGERLVVPAGTYAVRSNDTDYRFRPHSAFAHLSGLGTDHEPDSVLVLDPVDDGHVPTLFFHPRALRTDPEFYASPRYGEMWVGQRPSLDELSALADIDCAHFDSLAGRLAADGTPLRVIRGADPAVTALVDTIRGDRGEPHQEERDADLDTATSELRLIKDAFEVDELVRACEATAVGFESVVASLPDAVARGRGERWVEGVFGLHARHLGNAVGYDTISGGGDHACTLHWIRNDGDIVPGDLLLLDAGVELDSLYTADITRTLPVTGRFSPTQRLIYEAVLEAQQAGIDAARPGVPFLAVHQAAVTVLASRLAEWGLLPVSAAEALSATGGQYRRWMVHGTSHHLGLDVHDCAKAPRERYREGVLEVGMVITVEPGLYFKASDLLVPEEFRGQAVRIEDDILITDNGCRILSSALPRDPDEVEAWMAQILP